MYKYLLFDADNTLLNFNEGEKCALREVLNNTPLEFSDEVYETYHKINDDLWKRLELGGITRSELKKRRFQILFNHYGYNSDQYIEYIDSHYLVCMSKQSQIIDGALEVLEYLHNDYELYLATNATASVQRKRLSKTPFDRYFRKYYISEEIGVNKPEKAFFDRIVDDIGDDNRENYLVIGDSLSSDIKGAILSNIDSCYFDPNFNGYKDIKPTYTIHSLKELLIPKTFFHPMPSAFITSRPDVACSYLAEGYILLLADTSPFALILPCSIFQFTQSPEDYYKNPLLGTYTRMVRMLCLLVSLFLMPLFLFFCLMDTSAVLAVATAWIPLVVSVWFYFRFVREKPRYYFEYFLNSLYGNTLRIDPHKKLLLKARKK